MNTRLELSQFAKRNLYGGAISVDLPAGFVDASDLRQIPDYQECYLDQGGYSSIIFECLSFEDQDDSDALQTHFAALTDPTGDSTHIISDSQTVMGKVAACPLITRTFIQIPPTPAPNSSQKTPQFVYIHLLLLRLRNAGTDLLITINIPHYENEYEPVPEGGALASSGQTYATETYLMRDSEVVKQKIIETFDIHDWSLFNGEEEAS